MQLKFSVKSWSAWSEHLQSAQDWLDWAATPQTEWSVAHIGVRGSPSLGEVPAMQRRRLDAMSRMAFQVAWWAMPELDQDTPLVFASRHGDVKRSLELLRSQADGEAMSPTQFTLSVHNAVVANYSIIRGFKGFYTAIAAQRNTAKAAFIEAFALLEDGAPQVQIVVYDEPLPEVYADFVDEPEAAYAWSMVLAKGGDLELDAGSGLPEDQPALPAGLLPLALYLSTQKPCAD